MRRSIVTGLAAALICGLTYAGPPSGKEFEGELLSARMVYKLKKEGAHRYADQFMTHNAKELKHEIDLLNMLNSLYLTETQMNSIIIAAARAERQRRKFRKEIEKLNAVLEKGYAQLRERALKGEDVCDKDLPAACKKAKARLAQIRREIYRINLKGQMTVKAILTEDQLEKVYNYEHCLIPVKDLKDPTRIGQADAASASEKLLERIRTKSDKQFEEELPRLIDCHIKKIEHKCGEMTPDAKKKEAARFKAVLLKARKMDDLDFEFNRGKLGAELAYDYYTIKDRMMHLNMRLGKVRNDACAPHIDVVGSMFLSPNMLHILAKRVNISAGFKGTKAVDLDKIENAATNAGGCAID